MEYTAIQEAARIKKMIYSNPAQAQALANAYPDPQQRENAIMAKAAMNAKQISEALLVKKQKEFGIKEITPAVVREAFHEDRAQFEPDEHVKDLARAAGVTDPTADYRHNVMPKSVDHDMAGVIPYLFPEQQKNVQQNPVNEQPVQQQKRPIANIPVVENSPAQQTELEGTSFGGEEPTTVSGGGEGSGMASGGTRMYQPGTEA